MKTLTKLRDASIINRLLAMKFASEFIVIYALYAIMFVERGHLPLSRVGVILSLGYILSIAFEIPTGIIADKIARKYVLMLSFSSKVIGLLLWLLFPFFGGFIAGTAFFALGTALENGALQAYLYGTLTSDSKRTFNKFWGRLSAMVMISYSLAYFTAGLIGVNYPVLLITSIVPCLLAILICSTLPKDSIARQKDHKPKILAGAVKHILKSAGLMRLLVGSILIISVADVMIEYMSLYYNQIGVPTKYVPFVFIPGNLLGAILFWSLHSWEKFLDKNKVLLTLSAVTLFAATISLPLGGAVAGFIVFSRFVRVLQVQFESSIQHLSSDEVRATITSIGTFITKLMSAAIIALVGFSAHGDSIVKPFRAALFAGVGLFVIIQIIFRIRDARQTG